MKYFKKNADPPNESDPCWKTNDFKKLASYIIRTPRRLFDIFKSL